jgi:hypothetical protein
VLGDHTVDSGVEFPINIMIVDQTGEASTHWDRATGTNVSLNPRDWAVPPALSQ